MSFTDSVKREIVNIEQSSFVRHCNRLGRNVAQFKVLSLKSAQNNIKQLIESYSDSRMADLHREMYLPQLETEDFWEFHRLQNEMTRSEIATHISENRSILPIDYDYVSKLCLKIGLEQPTEKVSNGIEDFLRVVPTVSLFDLEFNAFVESRTIVDREIPCIAAYLQLLSSCEIFIDTVIPLCLNIHNKKGSVFKNPQESKEVASNLTVQDLLKRVFALLLARTDYIEYDYEMSLRSNPLMVMPFQLMSRGAANFVWYHEFGHLLMGHLKRGPCHDVEFSADRFAWELCQRHYDTELIEGFWNLLGAIIVLITISCLEELEGRGSETHPDAISRIDALLTTLSEEKRRILRDVISSIKAVFKDTICSM